MTWLQPWKGAHPRFLDLARRVWSEADRDNVPGLAAQVAFYFSLALFPFFIFLAAVAGTLPFTGLWERVLAWVLVYLPSASRFFVFDTISSLTRGHARFLSIGLLGTVWAACVGLMNLTCCLNAAYEVKETRSYWRRLTTALILTLLMASVVIGSFALLTTDTWIEKWLGAHRALVHSWPVVWQAGRWTVSLALLALGISVLDNVLPNLRRPWQWLSPGTIFVVAAWVPATLGFNFYVQHVASYDKTYGALGAFVILMIWIYVSSLLTLLGATLNCELRKTRSEPTGGRSAPGILFRRRAARAAAKEHRRASGHFRAWTVLLAVLSVADYHSLRLSAQEPEPSVSFEGQKVAFVDLVGRAGGDVEGLRPLVLQQAAEPYSEEKVRSTVDALMRTRRFSKVDIEVKPEATGLRVSFVLQPAFYIGVISFPGAEKTFNYPQLLQVVNYPSQEPYDESRVREAEISLQRFFALNGYFLARVQSQSQFDETEHIASLVFNVTLNQRARFGRVEVSGPPPEQAGRLERELRSFLVSVKGASVKPGKPYDLSRLRAARTLIPAYLAKQDRLASEVRLNPPKYDPETNRADVNFQVTLGPTVRVRVAGARVSKRTLRKLIPIYEENAFDQDLVEEGGRNLVSYFQNKGYFDVKVQPQVDDDPNEILLVYQVAKGRRHRLVQVAIRGNRHFGDDDLEPLIAVKKGGFLSPGKLSNDLLRRSADGLAAYYRDTGYQDVKVEPKVVDREPQVFVSFEITEGPQTTVEALHVEGNRTQSIKTLVPDGLKLKPGQPYSQRLLNHDRDQIMASYLDLGYLAAVFKSTARPLPGAPPRVEVTYEIQEGPQTRISKVVDLGLRHTQKEFLDRTADIHRDAPLSERKLLDSESELYNAGIFDWASVGPRRPVTDQGQESVLVKVHEAKRNTLTYGFGLELSPRTANVPAGSVPIPGLPSVNLPTSVQVTQKQFLSPRGSIEYSRRNLRGRGETGSISALVSRLDQRGTFTYADPHFRGLNWSSLLSVSAERTTENPLFTARLGEASFQILRPLDAAKTKTLVFRYAFSRQSLTNLLIPELVLPADRSVHLSTLSASYIRDTRDKPLDAHRGLYQSFDFGVTPKVIGSSANFVRFLGQTAHYKQLRPWFVWANDVRLGLAKPFAGSSVPLSEKFFSGGATSLRGFPVYGAGPQRLVPVCSDPAIPSTCTNITVPVGGDALFIFNSEGRFPIPVKKGLGGVIFYDGGNVYRTINLHDFVDNYTNTVGFGLRYDTPVGPVRFDIGRNLNPVPGLKATQFFITLGQSF